MSTLIGTIVFALALALTSIVTMIYGWGITPKNWGWIAFGYAITMAPIVLNGLVADLTKRR